VSARAGRPGTRLEKAHRALNRLISEGYGQLPAVPGGIAAFTLAIPVASSTVEAR
jgi:hypothetical protein